MDKLEKLTIKGVTEYLDITVRTLNRWRQRGEFAPYDFLIGGKPAWKKESIDEFIRRKDGQSDEERRQEPLA